ncbi:MAG: polyprenyl synthetase family protein [Anaerolineales bacterium]
MPLSDYSQRFLPQIESQIKTVVEAAGIDQDDSLRQMISYHLGWTGPDAGPKAHGKRIRPLILLLAAEAVGGDFHPALPAAAAVEILHNFSLIHDDIEDNSETRRGRETLWRIHGIPLALNAGDAMFSLAFLAIGDLPHPAEIRLQATHIFNTACLELTKGQHLDISFESQDSVTTRQYLRMIRGKTAALLAACLELGALLGGASKELQQTYHMLGINVGLAFQVHDDILGIWGDASAIGKSTATDLLTRKKTLPILYGLEQKGKFSAMWQEEITPENVAALADQLEVEGALAYARQIAAGFTSEATELLSATPQSAAGDALAELIAALIQREA